MVLSAQARCSENSWSFRDCGAKLLLAMKCTDKPRIYGSIRRRFMKLVDIADAFRPGCERERVQRWRYAVWRASSERPRATVTQRNGSRFGGVFTLRAKTVQL